jgi:hypothetical protein
MTKTLALNNGSDRKHVYTLCQLVRNAINDTYATAAATDEASILRDWATDRGTRDRFTAMIDREKTAERAHRNWGPDWQKYHSRISVEHAATVICLSNIGDGATRTEPVTAEMFLTMRDGCAEAMQVGYLARVRLAPIVEQLLALDYAEIVKK